MTRHVTHLITAYVEGQLGPRRSRYVEQHIRDCARCRTALAVQQRFHQDLKLALGSGPYLSEEATNRIWLRIERPPAVAPSLRFNQHIAAVAATLMFFVLPFLLGVTREHTRMPQSTETVEPVVELAVTVAENNDKLIQPVSTEEPDFPFIPTAGASAVLTP